jgi:hypothetical protein
LRKLIFSTFLLLLLVSCERKSNEQLVIMTKSPDRLKDLIPTDDSFIVVLTGCKTCTNQYKETFCNIYDSLSSSHNMLVVISDTNYFDCLRTKFDNKFLVLSSEERNSRRLINVYYSFNFYYKKEMYHKLVIDYGEK